MKQREWKRGVTPTTDCFQIGWCCTREKWLLYFSENTVNGCRSLQFTEKIFLLNQLLKSNHLSGWSIPENKAYQSESLIQVKTWHDLEEGLSFQTTIKVEVCGRDSQLGIEEWKVSLCIPSPLMGYRENPHWTILHGQGQERQFSPFFPQLWKVLWLPTCAAVKGKLCGGVKLLNQELGQWYPLICF